MAMLRAQILTGTSWLLASRLLSNLLGLVSTLVAAHLLVPEDFGLMAIGMSVFGIASAVVELPVGAALIQMKTASKADFNTAWTINVLRGAIVSALMLAAAWPAALITGDDRVTGLVMGLAAYPLIMGLRNSWFEQYIRDMDFRREALLDLIAKVVSLVVTVSIAWATHSYWALPFSVMSGALVSTVLSYVMRPQLPAFDLSAFGKFFGFSVWVGLGNIADSLRDASTSLFISRQLGTANLGMFAVGSQFGERLETILYAPMERTLFAAFSSIQDDADRVRSAYLRSLQFGFAVIAPICIGIGLLSHEIIRIALGPDWSMATVVLAFIAPITGVYLTAGLSNSLANALGHPKAVFRFKIVSAVLHVPALAFGIFNFGLIGALWACAFTACLWYLFSLRVITTLTGVGLVAQVSVIGRTVISAAAMALSVTAVRWSMLGGPGQGVVEVLADGAILAATGALTYLFLHFLLWHLAGRPAGAEQMAVAMAMQRLRSRPAP